MSSISFNCKQVGTKFVLFTLSIVKRHSSRNEYSLYWMHNLYICLNVCIYLFSDHIQILLAAIAVVIQICDAGQMCSSCSDLASLGDCNRYVNCDNTEQCYQRQYANGSGTLLYELGCISSSACKHSPVMIGKRSAEGSHFKCFACCNQTFLCNTMLDCGKETPPIQNVCASCNNVSHPSDCLHHERCAKDENCYVYKYRTNSGSVFYDLGCTSQSVCSPTLDLGSHLKGNEDHHFVCLTCCENANCNNNLTCAETVMPTPTSTPTPTPSLPRDCSELQFTNSRNGSYTIFPYGVPKVSASVFCEFDSDGTWTVIQRRFNGSVDFYRNWTEYQRGFGSSDGEYWLGNDIIHQLTSIGNYTLKILLTDWYNHSKYAEYSVFYVASEANNYTLTIGGYSGNTSHDSMAFHNGHQFSTWDRDNDNFILNCAEACGKGAWWHNNCCHSNLNGVYSRSYVQNKFGMLWYTTIVGRNDAMKTSQMMIKRK